MMTTSKVLDHGSVELVEHWGSDERIIESARMSTNKGFLGWGPKEDGKPGDEKLLRYLYEHKHMTPFEMAGLTIEVQAPIFVFREWHRHRTQCLAGDTQISLVSPRGTTFKRTIKEIYDLKHGGVVDCAPRSKNGFSRAGTAVTRAARRKEAWRTRILPNCQERMLRVLDESDGTFHVGAMSDVWKSGVKEIFAVEAGGRVVRASAEHPFLTRRGWVKVKDLRPGDELARMGKVPAKETPIPPTLRQGIGVWTTMMRSRLLGQHAHCYVCGLEFHESELALDHVVPVSVDLTKALDVSNLRPACFRCHRQKTDTEQPSREGMTRRGVRWEQVTRMPAAEGEEETYDIGLIGPHHNFVANDFVVHNSYNELSARYTEVPELYYVPSHERLKAGAQSSKNKQAAGENLKVETAMIAADIIEYSASSAFGAYHDLLNAGLARELARLVLPVNTYSRMRASANLRNWLGFLTLRLDQAAQYEIRVYAEAVSDLVKEKFPRTWGLFNESK